ncbi:putative phosphopyruvate hydratase [Helianthus annuus]|nr:putative phosphopyruvate hydratase [Helianthus annuus]
MFQQLDFVSIDLNIGFVSIDLQQPKIDIFPEHIQRSSKSKVVIKKIYDHNATNVGDEGGFAPNIKVCSLWFIILLLG